ncbi:MAG: nodulation protein NfeD [Gemmatimonadota bacterium]
MLRSTFMTTLAFLTFAALSAGSGPENPSGHATGQAAPPRASVSVIRVEEPITPTTNDYIRRALAEASERGSAALVVELDTPGGLLESTREIVQALFESDLPVVVYVTPGGARAASAGTFITMAAHVAAMAPSTTIGAASPVSMGGGGEAQMDTVMQAKAFNYAESFIATIAERRGRNVDWAISAVRAAAAVTETEALELGVIDLVAADRAALLEAIDGRVVEGDTLHTAGAEVEEIPKNMAERFLGFITRPELMLLLSMIAIYGIIGEVTNPGGIVPGVTGVIALILLLYASAAMPVNLAGYLLLALAVVLFVSEAFTPAFGLLIAAGAVAFFMGALILFQDLPESLELSWAWLVPATALTTLFFVWIVTEGLRIQFAPARTGTESMIGQEIQVVDTVSPTGGRVFVSGEYWNAVSDQEIPAGEPCRIEKIDGLTLKIVPTDAFPARSTETPTA